MKVNPVYMYEDLKNVNIDLIPPGFKTPFRGDKIQKCGDDGFLCEVRLKVEVETVLVTGLFMVRDYSIKYCWDFCHPLPPSLASFCHSW